MWYAFFITIIHPTDGGGIRAGVSIFCLIVILIGVFSFLESPVIAEEEMPRTVVVSEVMWAGTEYVELYNTTDAEIDLAGWSLVREREVDGVPVNVTVPLEEGDKIAANGYFLLERKTLSDETPAMVGDNLGKIIRGNDLRLVNTGERLELRDPDEVLIDEVNRLDSWFFGLSASGLSRSMERIDPGQLGTEQCSWQTYEKDEEAHGRLGTPGAENSEAQNSLQAVIEVASNEVLEGDAVELDAGGSTGRGIEDMTYTWDFGDGNTGDEQVAVHSYDAAGTYEVELTIAECAFEAKEFMTIEVKEADEELVTPSPALYKQVNIQDIRAESTGTSVRVKGIVTALPGTFSGRQVYVSHPDSPVGLQIYLYTADFPHVRLGDEVTADGELSTVLGETRLKLDSAGNIVSTGKKKSLAPHSIKTGDIDETNEGALVTVSGAVTRSSGNTFYIDDGSGELRIVVKNSTGIQKPSTKQGNVLEITGVLSRTTLGFRLMPRMQADITLVEEEGEEENLLEDEKQEEEESEGEVAGDMIKKVALKDVRAQEIGEVISTEGVISVPPGVLGDRIAYISGSGLQLYFHKAEWPDLKTGDTVTVTGELASLSGELRLKISEAIAITRNGSGDVPVPHDVKTGAIGEELEGSLIRIAGHISQTSGDTFYVDDGSGEVRVVIKETTSIEKPRTKKGTETSIIGIVSETKSGYRILPRFQEDVAFGGEVAGLTSFPGTGVLKQVRESDRQGNIIFFFGGIAVMWLLSSGYRSGEPLLKR